MKFLKTLYKNCSYIILGTCIIGNSIAFMPSKSIIYGLAITCIFIYLLINAQKQSHKFKFYLFFIVALILSNIYNLSFDPRFFYFLFLILVCSPFFSSRCNLIFKIRFLYVFFYLIIFLTVVNLICFLIGINMYQVLNEEKANIFDFSGIMMHPMWLGAFSGLSTVISFYFFLSNKNINIKLIYVGLTLISVFVTVLSASRISLFSSLLVVCFLLFQFEIRRIYLIRYVILIILLSIISYPIFLSNSSRLQLKIENQKDVGKNSRQKLFQDRISEIMESPILGVGFATHLIRGRQVSGTMESGSGWLSVASQTGIIGFSCIIFIIRKTIKRISYLNRNKSIFIFYGVFIFLCLHSLAEGYILTSGYYLCFLFWLLLDVLVQHDSYNNSFKRTN